MLEHDITIPWSNKPTYNRHRVAIEAQDAVSLRGLAREFVKIVDNADAELRSTSAVWEDAAVRLFVNKFESLCRSEANYSEAYKVCQEKAGE